MATCPAGGTRLLKHTTTKSNASYDWFSCSVCGGVWVNESSFFFLHIEQLHIPLPSGHHKTHLLHPICPSCHEHLTVVHASKLSCPLYTIWHCPSKRHGYFVPFASIEKLQTGYAHAKRTIHIALAPFGFAVSIVIAAFFYIFLTFYTIGSTYNPFKNKTATPVVSHRAYQGTTPNTYTFTSTTGTQTKLILNLESMTDIRSIHMDTIDGLHHIARTSINGSPDIYAYSFRSIDPQSSWRSEWYTLGNKGIRE